MPPPIAASPWILQRLARWRVPLGFLCAAVAFGLVRPSWLSVWLGAGVATAGEVLRIWAAGHIEKGREITRSGPYRFVRHPLYLGSTLLGLGFVVAARSVIVGVVTLAYLAVTLLAAAQTEEAALDAKFDGAYAEYRSARAARGGRPFSWARVAANREYRAVAGLVAAFAWLIWRIG